MCELVREITSQMLKSYDKELANQEIKKLYRGKGKRKTSIKTVYGEEEYSRNVYLQRLKMVRRHMFFYQMKQCRQNHKKPLREHLDIKIKCLENRFVRGTKK